MDRAANTVNQRKAGKAGSRGRSTMRQLSGALWMVLLLAFAWGLRGHTQSQSNTTQMSAPRMPDDHRFGSVASDEDYDQMIIERRLRALNVERQKQLVADTNRLLKLTQDLHAAVSSENTGAWTPDELRKLVEIEKLAHNVKERMANGVGSAPSLAPTPILVYPNH